MHVVGKDCYLLLYGRSNLVGVSLGIWSDLCMLSTDVCVLHFCVGHIQGVVVWCSGSKHTRVDRWALHIHTEEVSSSVPSSRRHITLLVYYTGLPSVVYLP